MANLAESINYESGVYQLETTDQPLGGPLGIANRQGLQLANRTAWLKNERDTGNYCGGMITTDAAVFDVLPEHAGKIIRSFNAPAAPNSPPLFVLPLWADFQEGKSVYLFNYNNQNVPASRVLRIAAAFGSGNVIMDGYFAIPEYELAAGYGIELCKVSGVSNTWVIKNRFSVREEREQPGTIILRASSATPTGFVKCNGAALSRITYNGLFSAIGTTFGAGDGSTTFNIPDLRGEFVRGWDDGRGIDPGRTFGSWQVDDFKSHTHLYASWDAPGLSTTSAGGNFGFKQTGATGGTETRPRNVAMSYFIKF